MKLLVATRSATLAMARVSALLAAQRELARTQQRDANLDLEVQALAKVLVIQYKPDLVFFAFVHVYSGSVSNHGDCLFLCFALDGAGPRK